MQMIRHDLHAQHFDTQPLVRQLGKHALHQPPQLAQLDKSPALFLMAKPPERLAPAIIECDRDLIDTLPAVIPISTASPHPVNDIAHQRARIFIVMPPRRCNRKSNAFHILLSTVVAHAPTGERIALLQQERNYWKCQKC